MQRLALALAVLCTTAASAQTPESLANEFIRRFVAGDRRGTRAMWAADVKGRYLDGMAAAKCLELLDSSTDSVVKKDDKTEVDYTLILRRTDRSGSNPRIIIIHPVITVRTQPDVAIAEFNLGENVIADGFTKPPLEKAIADPIGTYPELITEQFVSRLRDDLVQLIDDHNLPRARSTLAVLKQAADRVGTNAAHAMVATAESTLVRVEGDLERGLELAREAVRLADLDTDANTRAVSLLSLARALQYSTGDGAAGEKQLRRIVEIRGDLENPVIASRAAVFLSGIAGDRGDYQRALAEIAIARQVAVATEDRVGLYSAEIGEGGVYEALNDCDAAIPHLKRAVELATALHFPNGVAGSNAVMARCYLMQDNAAAFKEAVDALLAAAKDGGNDTFYALGFAERGRFELNHGDIDGADADLAQAYALLEKVRPVDDRAYILEARAELRIAQHRYTEAVDLATRAEGMFGDIESPLLFTAYVTAAKALEALGDRQRAYEKLYEAVAQAELGREAFVGDDRETGRAFEPRVAAYHTLIDMLAQDGRTREALLMAEKAKSRSLLDILRAGHLGLTEEMTPDDREAEKKLEAEIAAANRTRMTSSAPAKPGENVRALRLKLLDFRTHLAGKYPALAKTRGPAPLADLDSLGAALPKDVAAFEFCSTEQALYVFRIRSDGRRLHVSMRTIALPQKKLSERVNDVVATLVQRDGTAPAKSAALEKLLFTSDDERAMRAARAVVTIPDDVLWRLPFEALRNRGGHYFGGDIAIVYAPSLSAWRELSASRGAPARRHELIAFANPSLREADDEVRAAAAAVGESRSDVYTGARVQERLIKAEIPGHDIVHFATHGFVDDSNPMYSFLVAGSDAENDGLLEARELLQMKLDSDLVVLSACNTARGEVRAGEGLVGLSWAILAAGARNVVASEWSVPSNATKDLITSFYRAWLRGHDETPFAKARAMLQARREVMRSPHRQHPYYWAGFVVIGSGE